MIGDGYSPINGQGAGDGQAQSSLFPPQAGNPTFYTQAPRDFMSSLIVSATTPADSHWTQVNQSQGPSYLELTEILLCNAGASDAVFALAVVPILQAKSFVLTGIYQPNVIIIQSTPISFSIRLPLSTAVYQNEQLFIWSNGTVNYRISGKVVTQ